MNLLKSPILKLVFMVIARLPLIGPHNMAEVELLRAGAKPVGTCGAAVHR